jgi:hypothetical protein
VNELEERLAMVAEEERRRSDGLVFGAYFAWTMFPVMGGSQFIMQSSNLHPKDSSFIYSVGKFGKGGNKQARKFIVIVCVCMYVCMYVYHWCDAK